MRRNRPGYDRLCPRQVVDRLEIPGGRKPAITKSLDKTRGYIMRKDVRKKEKKSCEDQSQKRSVEKQKESMKKFQQIKQNISMDTMYSHKSCHHSLFMNL